MHFEAPYAEGREHSAAARHRGVAGNVLISAEEYARLKRRDRRTHSAPRRVDDAIEIPPATQQRLGLDSERSWIVITEANEFVWPGHRLGGPEGFRDIAFCEASLELLSYAPSATV